MEAMEELVHLSDSMRQAVDMLNDEDIDDDDSRCISTFLNVVALGNTVCPSNTKLLISLCCHS